MELSPRRSSLFNNAVVYHLLIDRFFHGDGAWDNWSPDQEMHYQGGQLAGVTRKIREGWFTQLGVNCILISSPCEQIEGWIPDATGSKKHFPYHGYWPLDFTTVDPRVGSRADFSDVVAAAHAHGINIIMDVVIGHVGYADLATFARYRPEDIKPGWEDAAPDRYQEYFHASSCANANWGPGWIDSSAHLEEQGCLPQLALAAPGAARFPSHLADKESTLAVPRPDCPVRGYLVEWMAGWVREFGVDGFRCDSAKHVDLEVWAELKRGCDEAYREWALTTHGVEQGADFWMTGEVFGNGIGRNGYFDKGFDSLINFAFQPELEKILKGRRLANAIERSLFYLRLNGIYEKYARELGAPGAHCVLSYISSHDTFLFERGNLATAMTALLLLPGDVLVFYGDESGRLPGYDAPHDPAQMTRSPMNWASLDAEAVRHAGRLGRFRRSHPAIARGRHRMLSDAPYVFSRSLGDDQVLVVLGHTGELRIDVRDTFGEQALLFDAYAERPVEVADGVINLHVAGIALLETYGNDK